MVIPNLEEISLRLNNAQEINYSAPKKLNKIGYTGNRGSPTNMARLNFLVLLPGYFAFTSTFLNQHFQMLIRS